MLKLMAKWNPLFQIVSAILFCLYLRYTDALVPPLVALVFVLPLIAYFVFIADFITRWSRITVRGTVKLRKITQKQKSYLAEFETQTEIFKQKNDLHHSEIIEDPPDDEGSEVIIKGSHLGRMGLRRAELHYDPSKPLNEIYTLRDYVSGGYNKAEKTLAIFFNKTQGRQKQQFEEKLRQQEKIHQFISANVFKNIDALEISLDTLYENYDLFQSFEEKFPKKYEYFVYVTPKGFDLIEDYESEFKIKKRDKRKIANSYLSENPI